MFIFHFLSLGLELSLFLDFCASDFNYAKLFLLQVLLSPPIVVYSPRVLPVYVYDAHADCGENVRFVKDMDFYCTALIFHVYQVHCQLFCSTQYCVNSAAFLVLYGIALAIEGWGVVASLKIYPPFAGAAVSAITLVVAFGFAVSRPCLTLKVRLLIVE